MTANDRDINPMSLTTAAKLGSIVVHLEEVLADGHDFDVIAMRSLVNDLDVQRFVTALRKMALVPKSLRCRCITFRRGDDPFAYRCRRMARSSSGICDECRPIGAPLHSKRGGGRCGPERRLAPRGMG